MQSAPFPWSDRLSLWPLPVPDFTIDPAHTALLLVDMQYAHTHPDYGLGEHLRLSHPAIAEYYLDRVSRVVMPNQLDLLEFFRRHQLRVIYLTVGPALPSGADWLPRSRRRYEGNVGKGGRRIYYQGSREHQILDELRPGAEELVINKISSGAFNSSHLDQALRNMRIETLIVGGVVTNACVEITARDAADRGYNVALIEDACAALDQAGHDAAMLDFACMSGRVLRTCEVIDEIRSALDQGEHA